MYTNALTYLVVSPRSPKRPVIVEIPHAGLGIHAQAMVWSVAPLRSLARDADSHVDQLFASAPDSSVQVYSCRR
ncbi:MAG: hypothetical protein QM784_15285 [Polyangiaceae bacterium]